MSKMIQEKNDIFALYKKTIYINETYVQTMPLPRNTALLDELEQE